MTGNNECAAILVLCACGSGAEARLIADALVDSGAAACVNILPPMTSVYRWKGNVESAQEYLLTIKSVSERFAAVEEIIRSRHSYEVPEVIAVPIVAGSPPYLTWLREQVSEC